MAKPKVFFDIAIGDQKAGRIVMEVRFDQRVKRLALGTKLATFLFACFNSEMLITRFL